MGFTKIMAGLSCNASLFHPLGQSHPLIVNNPRNRGFASDLFMIIFGAKEIIFGNRATPIFGGIFYIKQLEITLLSFWGLLDLYALYTVHVPTCFHVVLSTESSAKVPLGMTARSSAPGC